MRKSAEAHARSVEQRPEQFADAVGALDHPVRLLVELRRALVGAHADLDREAEPALLDELGRGRGTRRGRSRRRRRTCAAVRSVSRSSETIPAPLSIRTGGPDLEHLAAPVGREAGLLGALGDLADRGLGVVLVGHAAPVQAAIASLSSRRTRSWRSRRRTRRARSPARGGPRLQLAVHLRLDRAGAQAPPSRASRGRRSSRARRSGARRRRAGRTRRPRRRSAWPPRSGAPRGLGHVGVVRMGDDRARTRPRRADGGPRRVLPRASAAPRRVVVGSGTPSMARWAAPSPAWRDRHPGGPLRRPVRGRGRH